MHTCISCRIQYHSTTVFHKLTTLFLRCGRSLFLRLARLLFRHNTQCDAHGESLRAGRVRAQDVDAAPRFLRLASPRQSKLYLLGKDSGTDVWHVKCPSSGGFSFAKPFCMRCAAVAACAAALSADLPPFPVSDLLAGCAAADAFPFPFLLVTAFFIFAAADAAALFPFDFGGPFGGGGGLTASRASPSASAGVGSGVAGRGDLSSSVASTASAKTFAASPSIFLGLRGGCASISDVVSASSASSSSSSSSSSSLCRGMILSGTCVEMKGDEGRRRRPRPPPPRG